MPFRDHLWCGWACEFNMGWFLIFVMRLDCDGFGRLKEVFVGEKETLMFECSGRVAVGFGAAAQIHG